MKGLICFSSAKAALQVERIRMRGLVSEARDRKADLADELRILLDSLQVFLDCGVNRGAIAEVLLALHAPIINSDHACNRTIDEAGEWFDPIDMAEVNALLAKVTA
jgi:hypothetical protein